MNIGGRLAAVIVELLRLYQLVIIIRALMSWFVRDHSSGIYMWLVKITEPVLAPIRRIMPRFSVDFSAVVAILLIGIVITIIRSI
ncbi:MAG TPA: YggT family protein [Candidatus Syntrophosphaera sp.]|nr:YggT family protein [Candidatus Syntrophosphaera sp.]HPH61182.1 YggT family protein [Candidatus Syntrophosphaera sp.]